MADQKTAPVAATGANCFKEAVCIDAGRIYDSCTEEEGASYAYVSLKRPHFND